MDKNFVKRPMLPVVATWIAAAISFGVLSRPASAQEAAQSMPGCVELANGVMRCSPPGERSREAVRAELRNAQAAGELRVVGERSVAPEGAVVPAGVALTRQEVKARLALAVSNHERLHFSEL